MTVRLSAFVFLYQSSSHAFPPKDGTVEKGVDHAVTARTRTAEAAMQSIN
jgi:hypothetical protein